MIARSPKHLQRSLSSVKEVAERGRVWRDRAESVVHCVLALVGFDGQTFAHAAYAASLCMGATAALHLVAQYCELHWFQYDHGDSVRINNAVWNGMTSLLGFLVVFRSSQAYGRYWHAYTSVNLMRAEVFESCSGLIAFCRNSKAGTEKTWLFEQTIVRLSSLLHCTSVMKLMDAEISSYDDYAMNMKLLNPSTFDESTLHRFQHSPHKVELLYQWIQQTVVQGQKDGVLNVPPPILSRAFQELSNGMVKYHEALKVKTIPFPQSYAAVCDNLLWIHWCITPFMMCLFVNSSTMAALFAFTTVFTLWSVVSVAKRIENPFSMKSFCEEATAMQNEINEQLLTLLTPANMLLPTLPSLDADKDEIDLESMGELHSIDTLAPNRISLHETMKGLLSIKNQGTSSTSGRRKKHSTHSCSEPVRAQTNSSLQAFQEACKMKAATAETGDVECSHEGRRSLPEAINTMPDTSRSMPSPAPEDLCQMPEWTPLQLCALLGESHVGATMGGKSWPEKSHADASASPDALRLAAIHGTPHPAAILGDLSIQAAQNPAINQLVKLHVCAQLSSNSSDKPCLRMSL